MHGRICFEKNEQRVATVSECRREKANKRVPPGPPPRDPKSPLNASVIPPSAESIPLLIHIFDIFDA
jgi:hypothetical protein